MRYVRVSFGRLLVATLVASCAAVTDPVDQASVAAPQVVALAPPAAPPTMYVPVSAALAPATHTAIPRTAVIVSADIPDYMQVAAEILRRGAPNVTVHSLSAQPTNASDVLAALENARPDRIIAVGLPAAVVARAVRDTPMVFCQVYNYQDHDLVSATSKGVEFLPPAALQLRAWRELARNLRRVGAISGPGHEALLVEMRQAAAAIGIELATRVVRSDREALHEFRDLAADVDGLWLLPDNRILSPSVLQEIFSYSAAHAKSVAAFGDGFLEMGALLSFKADPRDVVDRVLERFEVVGENGRLVGPDTLRLTGIQTRVNDDVAVRMGLVVSADRATAAR